jgi:DNA-binding response OmpR family regulator
MSEVLVVEDEPSIAEVVGLYLTRAGFDVRIAEDGETALEEFSRRSPDLVILDLMLPELDGFAVTGRIREQGDVPIIMVTSRKTEADRIAGLEMGADDYVVKPFSPQELVSRVRAVLRRATAADAPADGPALEFDGLSIDPGTRTVVVRGEDRSLTAKEFDLLLTLAHRPRHVYSRDQLLELVWGTSDYIDPSTVTVHVRRVREKIEEDPSGPRWVTTVWGVGYRFEP